ncbi:SRPBCC family protein [Actinomadura geliboluensis]|nr:SRPBCC family protein [Actinomadura geliboluensis]
MSQAAFTLTRPPMVKEGMLIRRPAAEVFRAFADPAVTTRFWFTKSSGKLVPGTTVRWEWEMYGASVDVRVKEAEEGERIVFDWGPEDAATTVTLRFVPWKDDTTYVQVTETGFSGDGDTAVARVADSTGGFTMTLCALKALLEHDIELAVVADHSPPGLEI